MNKKSTPNEMRDMIGRMRGKEIIIERPVMKFNEVNKNGHMYKEMSMRDMLKITRDLNEGVNKKTVYDQEHEEQKFKNFFDDINVSIKFIDLEIYDNLIFWGGTVDGIIQFVYKVTPDEATSGVKFNYLEDFTPDNPENDEIINKIEKYYDIFYKYWRDNIIYD